MKSKQLCVGFGPRVVSFQLLLPGRFLLHEGDVTLLEKKKKKKVLISLLLRAFPVEESKVI